MAETETQKVRTFKSEDAQQIDEFLKCKLSEPVPESDTLTLRKLVKKLYPTLKELRDKGYTLQMLVALLEQKGVRVKTAHLSAHMTAVKRDNESNGSRSETNQTVQRDRESAPTSGRRGNGSFQMKPDTKL